MGDDRHSKWDSRHAAADDIGTVAAVLTRNAHLLQGPGRALDLACGRGANALWLAGQGYQVCAWDYSEVALARLREAADGRRLQITAERRDVTARPPATEGYDLILVSYFLERTLCPAIQAALKPNGLLCYQTFSQDAPAGHGPANPAFRLAPNELLRLFPGLRLRYYREEGELGDCTQGERGVAMMIAQKSTDNPVRVVSP